MLPGMKPGVTSTNGTAERGEGGRNRKEGDEKLPTAVSDCTRQLPEGGMGHHPVGRLQGTHLPAVWPWLTCKRQSVSEQLEGECPVLPEREANKCLNQDPPVWL